MSHHNACRVGNSISKNTGRGFVALFLVTMIGFLATIFMLTSAPRAWLQATDVTEVRSVALARFNAISCLQIARLKIFLDTNFDPTEIEGEYYTRGGSCSVEHVAQTSGKIIVKAGATKNSLHVSLEAELTVPSLEIASMREL